MPRAGSGAGRGLGPELHSPAAPTDIRLLFVSVGTLFFGVGILALGKTLVAMVTLATGGTLEGRLVYGFLIGLPFAGFGALAIWVFVRPDMRLRLDGGARQAVLTRTYPFGFVRQTAFDLAGLSEPEVVWQEDSDRIDGGFWELKLDLPGQRPFRHRPAVRSLTVQRTEAEQLRAAITRLLDA